MGHLLLNRVVRVLAAILIGAIFLFGALAASAFDPHDQAARTAWQLSAHADRESPAFTRWNNSSRGTIPASCARCHSTTGYLDYLGLDGSTPGKVDSPAPLGGTVECNVCHNDLSGGKTESVMPSGKTVNTHSNEAFCLDCHQGSGSGTALEAAVAELEPDDVSTRLRLPDLHNNPAGATRFGRRASGGYEYAGRRYAREYQHSLGYTRCDACHDRHTLEVKGSECASCHIGARSREGRLDIRFSSGDFDGDSNLHEGIAMEIETLRARLLEAIEVYALRTRDVAPITYQAESPWFVDEEGKRYRSWTPRLARAAYNYIYTGEKGGYSHNPVYLLQLLHDSLSDLGTNMAGMIRAGKS